jgi:hypothetical protein
MLITAGDRYCDMGIMIQGKTETVGEGQVPYGGERGSGTIRVGSSIVMPVRFPSVMVRKELGNKTWERKMCFAV